MDYDKLIRANRRSGELPTPMGLDINSAAPEQVQYFQQDSSTFQLFIVLLKHKWTIAAVAIAALTIGAFATYRTTRIYDASGRIAIFREQSDLVRFKDSVIEAGSDDITVDLDTQSRFIQSDAIAADVIRQLGWDRQNSANPASVPTTTTMAPGQFENRRQSAMLDRFHDSLRILTLPRTRILEIHFLDPDPKLAAQAVNALINVYIDRNIRAKYEATMKSSEFLSDQLADLQAKVQTSQEKLVRYQKEHDILGIDEKQNIITSKLDQMNKELTVVEADRMNKESSYRLSRGGDAELLGKSDSIIDHLRDQRAQLKAQHARLSVTFGPAYPKVVELGAQLAQVDSALNAEIAKTGARMKAEYEAALQREKLIRAALEEQKKQANRLNESAIEYNQLKHESESNRQLYDGLLQKLKEAGVEAGLKPSNVRVLDFARVPSQPAKPNVPRNLELSLILGLCGGIGLAFLLEHLNNTINTPDEAGMIAGLPALGMVPLVADGLRGHVTRRFFLRAADPAQQVQPVGMVTHAQPRSELAEAYRAIRTSILLSGTGAPPKVILVTSPLPEEGKTTTSVNCAIVLAQKASRVLLVDADLRRSGIHRVTGVKNVTGLSSILAGNSSFAETLQVSTQVPYLHILPAGPVPPYPAELLGSAEMHALLAQWREQFDYIVIDTPPALTVTDAVVMSSFVDAVVLVVRSGKTTEHALRRTRELLSRVNARVCGLVVNAVNPRDPDYYYYNYGSKYGGKYYDEGRSGA